MSFLRTKSFKYSVLTSHSVSMVTFCVNKIVALTDTKCQQSLMGSTENSLEPS